MTPDHPIKRRFLNVLLPVLFITAALGATEWVLSYFPQLGNEETKAWVMTPKQWGNCYSSLVKNGSLADLRNLSSQKEELIRGLGQESVEHLLEQTPYCVFYDIAKRRQGAFPERAQQALIVGGSFGFGTGIKQEDTLAFLLSQKFPNVNFKNFASPGANILQVFETVFSIIQTNKSVKSIIFILNLNDLLDLNQPDSQDNDFLNPDRLRWSHISPSISFVPDFFKQSKTFRLLFKTAYLRIKTKTLIQNYLDRYFKEGKREPVAHSLLVLNRINQLAGEQGIRFQVVIYPMLIKNAMGKYPFHAIHQFIYDFCLESGISCVDTTDAFAPFYSLNKFMVHPIDAHPNGAANRLVVDYLLKTQKLKIP